MTKRFLLTLSLFHFFLNTPLIHLPQCTLFGPKILYKLCFSFLLGTTSVPMLMQNFGGFANAVYSTYRGGSTGWVQGVRTPPSPPPWDDLRFSNTTGILQTNKKLKKINWFIGVEVKSKRRVHPFLKEILDPPLTYYDNLFELSVPLNFRSAIHSSSTTWEVITISLSNLKFVIAEKL